jgi:thiol-disulfide isomerase/thioredoxin
MRKTLLFLILLAAAFATQAQTKRKLQFTIEGTAKDTVYLASYYGNKLYYSDTAVANAKGVSVFNRPSGYVTGVYAVVVPGPKYFEIIVNEPDIEMTSDTASLSGHLVVKRSDENQLFQDYVHYLNDKKQEADGVSALMDSTADPIAKGRYRKQLAALETDIKDYQKELVKKHPDTFVATIVRMSIAPEGTEVYKPDGSLDSSATYYNYRAHFWDNTDLKDPRILHTPVFQNRFDEYVGKVIPQIPDTISKCVDDLIHRMDDNGELFKFAVNAITYKYESSDIMGMDAVFVHMAQTYYCPSNGQKSRVTWMPADKMDKLCERAGKMAPLVLGATGLDIILTDTTEHNWLDYYKLPSKYVLLVFWDPHCGHCKKALPPLYEDYKEKLRPLGVEVFAVAKATDSVLFNDWKAFIRDNHLDWVNVGLTWHVYEEAKKASYKFIPAFTTIESLNYADTWDVFSTPKFFLMDADHKIVGKQLDADQMVDLIHVLDKRKKE